MPDLAPAEKRPRLTTLGDFVLFLDAMGYQSALRASDVVSIDVDEDEDYQVTCVRMIAGDDHVSYNPITDWLEILVYGSEASNG